MDHIDDTVEYRRQPSSDLPIGEVYHREGLEVPKAELEPKTLRLDLLRLARYRGWLPAVALLIFFSLFLITVIRHPMLSPFTVLEEQLNYYVAARNFLTFGFSNSSFLLDLSTSAAASEHPYVYTHVPPGPDIATALVMRLVGDNYRVVRVTFSLLFLAGIVSFVAVLRMVAKTHNLLRLEWYGIFFLAPLELIRMIDHPAYSAFPLTLFGPIAALGRYRSTGRRRWLAASLVLATVTAYYSITPTLILTVSGWLLLSLLRLVDIPLRQVVLLLTAAVLSVAFHILHVAFALGPNVFAHDLIITLSNRVTGQPPYRDVVEFYQSHNLVLHGRHVFDPRRYFTAVRSTAIFPGIQWFFILAALPLLASIKINPSRLSILEVPVHSLVGVAALCWSVITILTPLLVFPAYITDYGLQGRTFPIAFTCAVVLATASTASMSAIGQLKTGRRWLPLLFASSLGLVLVAALVQVIPVQAIQIGSVALDSIRFNKYSEFRVLERELSGHVVMTNVYPTTVGFFTRAAVLGLCEREAFDADLTPRPTGCETTFIRGVQHPRAEFYVLFKEFVAGFASCRGTCLDDFDRTLRRRYRVFVETSLFVIFDLSSSPTSPSAVLGKRKIMKSLSST